MTFTYLHWWSSWLQWVLQIWKIYLLQFSKELVGNTFVVNRFFHYNFFHFITLPQAMQAYNRELNQILCLISLLMSTACATSVQVTHAPFFQFAYYIQINISALSCSYWSWNYATGTVLKNTNVFLQLFFYRSSAKWRSFYARCRCSTVLRPNNVLVLLAYVLLLLAHSSDNRRSPAARSSIDKTIDCNSSTECRNILFCLRKNSTHRVS